MTTMLKNIEDVVGKFVETPLEKTKASLDKLIRANKKHPGPLLAKAFLVGFGRYDDVSESLETLKAAGALLKRGDITVESDAEGEFARALYEIMSAEANLRIQYMSKKATTRSVIEQEKQCVAAQEAMGNAVKRLRGEGSGMARLLYATLRTMSLSNATSGSRYKSGLRSLSKLRSNKSVGKLAGFFQIYAHRRKRNYPSAIRAGKRLEKEVPNSALVKRTTASCYYYSGKLSQADRYLKQAEKLAPNDLTIRLDRARTLARLGKAREAKKLIDFAARKGSPERHPQSHRSALHLLNIATIGEHRF